VAPGDEHPQYVVVALTRLDEAREPVSGPVQQFAEYAPEANPETKKKGIVWFALNNDRPLATFAGIWTEYKRRPRGASPSQSPAHTWSMDF
jgi:hypothetical protein